MNDKVQIKNCRPFTMIHNDFLDYEGLNSKEKLVMITLMRYDGTAFPSIPKLSKKIGLSERTVRYALKIIRGKKFYFQTPHVTQLTVHEWATPILLLMILNIWKSENIWWTFRRDFKTGTWRNGRITSSCWLYDNKIHQHRLLLIYSLLHKNSHRFQIHLTLRKYIF